MKQRVHIGLSKTLKEDLRSENYGADQKLDKLTETFDLERVNKQRAKRFGVLTADAPQERLDELQASEEVEWIEADGVQEALSDPQSRGW
jgi:hypothetical protein